MTTTNGQLPNCDHEAINRNSDRTIAHAQSAESMIFFFSGSHLTHVCMPLPHNKAFVCNGLVAFVEPNFCLVEYRRAPASGIYVCGHFVAV